MNPARIALAALAALATACSISPGAQTAPSQFCRMEPIPLDVDIEGDPTAAGSQFPDTSTLGGRILTSYRRPPAPGPQPIGPEEPVSGSIILLSGGGEDGAFGAGFLDAWSRARPRGLPRARIVTGISTGAILSTFAFIDQPDRVAQQYAIEREEDILQPYSDSRDTLGQGLTAVRRGAVADLSPLRRRLLANIGDAEMQAIEAERDAGRSLFVGAVDMDSGRAVAFDLTALAARYNAARRGEGGEDPELLRGCYVDAIIASSSVPMAAPPVFIDNRMYIDGGARFGVFTREFEQVTRRLAEARPAAGGAGASPRFLYVIMNSDMVTAPQCRTSNEDPCPPEDDFEGRHADWDLPGLASRSLSVLINQIYRFSAARLHDIADREDFGARVEYIRPDLATHRFPAGGPTCPEARAEDVRVDHPVEFHRRFMACLIDYGRMRAGRSGWPALEPAPGA